MFDNDPYLKVTKAIGDLLAKGEWALTKYRKARIERKLKHEYKSGERVQATLSGTLYTGTVLDSYNMIYSNGMNGSVVVNVKWDNPASHWKDGIFGTNQKFLERI